LIIFESVTELFCSYSYTKLLIFPKLKYNLKTPFPIVIKFRKLVYTILVYRRFYNVIFLIFLLLTFANNSSKKFQNLLKFPHIIEMDIVFILKSSNISISFTIYFSKPTWLKISKIGRHTILVCIVDLILSICHYLVLAITSLKIIVQVN